MRKSWARRAMGLVLAAGLALAGGAGADSHGHGAGAAEETAKEAAGKVRFGLTEPQRREAFRELMEADKRAQREAAEQFKDKPQSKGQVALAGELVDRYEREIAEKYGITEKQLVEIGIEGFKGSWPTRAP
ncbi:MAG: hypothetical protein QNK03_28040 [Myxococcota bacterium]|nr:hypothetical protein [Myxococcota bacterium]